MQLEIADLKTKVLRLTEQNTQLLKKLKDLLTNLNALRGEVHLLEREKEESWGAELERTVQSRKTTPITEDDLLQTEAWSTMEQAILSELGEVREYAHEVPRLYKL